ncbi:30S ribosomal protein S8 [Salisaeta longa]|uniref:30S ribosomal protein S8 n=1 Tax=Salisaeta longa TaxID=503170 RepID=UPI0003B5AAE1|nr:30S ribosomal protein S8 [Salisaeta longa]
MSGISDPVADYLARIKNGQQANHQYIDIPASRLKRAITQILLEKGYIKNYLNIDDGKQGLLRLYLKYDEAGLPAIKTLDRVSRPGLREYAKAQEVPRVKNGLGIAILSTSRGVMSDKEARRFNVGGEVLAKVF